MGGKKNYLNKQLLRLEGVNFILIKQVCLTFQFSHKSCTILIKYLTLDVFSRVEEKVAH